MREKEWTSKERLKIHVLYHQADRCKQKRKRKKTRSGCESTTTWMMRKAIIYERKFNFDESVGAGGNKDSENQGGRGRDIKSKRLSAAIHRMYRYLNRIRKGGVRVQRRREGPCLLRFHHVREGRWGGGS